MVAAAGLDLAGGVDVDAAEDGEEPGFAVGAEFELIDTAKGAEEGFLDEVLRAGVVADHSPADGINEVHQWQRLGFEESAFLLGRRFGGGKKVC